MKLIKIRINNFRGIREEVIVHFDSYNVIVGQNDAGKSTVLRALNAFINDKDVDRDSSNIRTASEQVEIEMYFNANQAPIIIDEQIETTFEAEGLTDGDGYVVLKKVWNTGASRIIPEFSFLRKKYAIDDFLIMSEPQLMALCKKRGIDTSKGNGSEFNNVEKRGKLRESLLMDEIAYEYEFEKPPASGASRPKIIADVMKNMMPSFEYFKADSSLEETDTTIQNYFKKIALQEIEQCDTREIQARVAAKLSRVMTSLSDKVNQVVSQTESIDHDIKFDWTKLVQTSFKSSAEELSIPLKNRGDGFRRLTMMAYFEHLAEEGRQSGESNVIYGFEEPETFLHPSAQEKLFLRLKQVSENGAQVFVTTHSPTIVSHSDRGKLIHVTKQNGATSYQQEIEDYSQIVNDLGISPNNLLLKQIDSASVLLLVEGPNDIIAYDHLINEYKVNGLVQASFTEMGVIPVPVGGCNSIQHWISFNVIKALRKPFFVILDSDKDSESSVSANLTNLVANGLVEGQDFHVLRKRALENYIDLSYFVRSLPELKVSYGPFDNVKNYAKRHPGAIKLGGGKIAEYHFCNQNIAELQASMAYEGGDEFLDIIEALKTRLPGAPSITVAELTADIHIDDIIANSFLDANISALDSLATEDLPKEDE